MFGIPGNLLSSPVIQTGIPGLIWPITVAFLTLRAFVPTSLDVMPPLATINDGLTVRSPITLTTAFEISTET